MFVCCVCCQVEVSATSWSVVQRSPTDCGASLCVIKKPRGWGGHSPHWAAGGHSPRWAAEPGKIINNMAHDHWSTSHIFIFLDWHSDKNEIEAPKILPIFAAVQILLSKNKINK
jgi:hypothetical protein